jgi:UDP-N-acetylglucosamine--N-acetylmuramyl-(pentapeptide) pyrophosphoryl-undecaprenol N-acetylglucosamine transferase
MVAVIEALEAAGVPTTEVVIVGSRRGQESQLLAGRTEHLSLLPGRGLLRSVAPRALAQNLRSVVALVSAVVAATGLMIRWRPRAVVSFGGYAAAPADLAAVLCRRRLVLVDFDATPGATHRLVGKFAARRCTAFPSEDPRGVVTGAPIRAEIAAVERTDTAVSRTRRGEQNAVPWHLVVMTGSIGASSVNTAVVDLAESWRDRADLRLTHVTGRRDFDRCAARWVSRPTDRLQYRQIAFADMAPLWSSADLAITRAGAMTVAELSYLGVPAVLVPLPGSPGDHQGHNAAAVVDAGGGVRLTDSQVSAEALATAIAPLLDVEVLARMETGALSLRRENGAPAIAAVVLEVAR